MFSLMKKRSKNRIQHPYTLKHIYDSYTASIEKGSPYDVEKKLFIAICEEWFKYLADIMIEQSGVVQLHYRLGHLFIAKNKSKDLNKLATDWITSKTVGKKVYHLNPHTDGFKYRFAWSKQRCIVKNKGLYRFKVCRDNARQLAYAIKNKQHDYLERGIKFKDY